MGDARREKRSKIKNLKKARSNMKAELLANNNVIGDVVEGTHLMAPEAVEKCQARSSILIGKIVDAEATLEYLGEKIDDKMIDIISSRLSSMEDAEAKAEQEFEAAKRRDFRLKKRE